MLKVVENEVAREAGDELLALDEIARAGARRTLSAPKCERRSLQSSPAAITATWVGSPRRKRGAAIRERSGRRRGPSSRSR